MFAAAVFVVTGCTAASNVTPSSGPGAGPDSTATTSANTAFQTPSTSASVSSPAASPTVSTPPVPTSYVPPPDGPAVAEQCPYLTTAQVEAATGDAVGAVRTRAGGAYPSCVFRGSGGQELATIRVLKFESDVQAALAVDHYLPADQSSLETRPPGWEGGSMRSASGSVVGIHRNGVAVIVTANVLTQPARELARQAIATLGL